jgi:peptide/nickel transport system ATP-binding protein
VIFWTRTHNLKVVAHISDFLMVMQQGRVVEAGPTEGVMAAPEQSYTRVLMGFGRPKHAPGSISP